MAFSALPGIRAWEFNCNYALCLPPDQGCDKTHSWVTLQECDGAPEDSLAQLLHVLQDLREAHGSSLASPAAREPHHLLELQT